MGESFGKIFNAATEGDPGCGIKRLFIKPAEHLVVHARLVRIRLHIGPTLRSGRAVEVCFECAIHPVDKKLSVVPESGKRGSNGLICAQRIDDEVEISSPFEGIASTKVPSDAGSKNPSPLQAVLMEMIIVEVNYFIIQ